LIDILFEITFLKISKIMSKLIHKCIMIFSSFLFVNFNSAQTVKKIGNNSSNINSSALLELESTTKGFLPPRLTYAQIMALSNPDPGLIVFCTDCGLYGELVFYSSVSSNGWCNSMSGSISTPLQVTSTTGKIWMAMNLGAVRVATSSNDANGYGDLYQWGRAKDGHQSRSSSTSPILLGNFNMVTSLYITGSSDWLTTTNNNLWQGINGANNPCPTGYRIPTQAEWQAEITSMSSNGLNVFTSVLKLTFNGYRNSSGQLSNINTNGLYWSSTISTTTSSMCMAFNTSLVGQMFGNSRSLGEGVRCIKN
jgi:uncharacterized protein (TIGR02145 family)